MGNGREIEDLVGSNYAIWNKKMEDLLYEKDLASPIENDGNRPTGVDEGSWKKMDRKCLSKIRKYVDMSIFEHVSEETTAIGAWLRLKEMFESKSAVHKVYLVKALGRIEYQDGKSMAEHLNEVQSLLNKLQLMKVKFDDDVQATYILASLPDSWNTLVVSLQNSTSDGVLSKTTVTSALLNEELRRKGSSRTTQANELLMSESRGSGRGDGSCKKSWSKARQDKSTPCTYCGKPGHLRKFCWKLKSDKMHGGAKASRCENDDDDSATVVTFDEGECYVSIVEGSCEDASFNSTWVMDTGATSHVSPCKSFFTSYKAGDFGSLKMANASKANVVGKGDVFLRSSLGSNLLLKNVLHVPHSRMNVISGGVLDGEGYVSSIANGLWELSKDSLVVMKGLKSCGLYLAQATVSTSEVEAICGMTHHMGFGKRGASALSPISSKGTVVDHFACDVDSPLAKEFSPIGNVVEFECHGFDRLLKNVIGSRLSHSLSKSNHGYGELFGAYVSSSSRKLKRNVPRRMSACIMVRCSMKDGDAPHLCPLAMRSTMQKSGTTPLRQVTSLVPNFMSYMELPGRVSFAFEGGFHVSTYANARRGLATSL